MSRALVCCFVAGCAAPQPPRVPDAAAVMKEMAATYAHAKTYVDHGEAVWAVKDRAERVTFATTFERPDKLHFTYQPVELWSLGGHTYVRGNDGHVEEIGDLASAVQSVPSLAVHAIPHLLLPDTIALDELGELAAEADQPIAGHPCAHLTGHGARGRVDLWIDRDAHVLRRVVEALHVDGARPIDGTITTNFEPALDRPVTAAELAAPDLATVHDGRKPWVGVRFEPNTRRIVQVFAGSPAEHAGLRPGDEITFLDGAPIAVSGDFIQRVTAAKVGTNVAIIATRAGSELRATLTLVDRPAMDALQRDALVGKPAPAFGKLVEYSGHVVVLDFWGTWCGPCQMVVPHLNDLQAKYPSARVLGLASDSDPEIREWVRQHFVAYPMLHDEHDAIAGAYAVQGLPTIVVIDKTGVVRAVELGATDLSSIDALVGRLVK